MGVALAACPVCAAVDADSLADSGSCLWQRHMRHKYACAAFQGPSCQSVLQALACISLFQHQAGSCDSCSCLSAPAACRLLLMLLPSLLLLSMLLWLPLLLLLMFTVWVSWLP